MKSTIHDPSFCEHAKQYQKNSFKIISKNYLQKIVALVLLGSMILSCSPDPDPAIQLPAAVLFSNTNTNFQQLTAQLQTNAGGSFLTSYIDVELHSYTFEMATAGKIYSFGYQSQPAVSGKTYLIELVDNSTGSTIYSQSSVFTSNAISYITIPTPINIVANRSYTLKRTFRYTDATLGSGPTFIAPYLYNFGDIIGSGLRKPSGTITFPINVGDMKITGTYCNQRYAPALTSASIPLLDTFIPFIDFAFTP